jgi:hypothetical protein
MKAFLVCFVHTIVLYIKYWESEVMYLHVEAYDLGL